MEEVENKVNETEFVTEHGRFKHNEWKFPGEMVPLHVLSVHLPNAIGIKEEKALVLSWDVAICYG